MCALFSQDIFQAGAVLGLNVDTGGEAEELFVQDLCLQQDLLIFLQLCSKLDWVIVSLHG